MSDASPASVETLRACLLELEAAVTRGEDARETEGVLEEAQRLWEAHVQAFGLVLLDDHDPHVAPGLHVTRTPGPLTPSRVRQLARSWETFDRAFEACSMEDEEALFDERIAPCFLGLGVALADVDLAQNHMFVIDERCVASFPAERWDAHAARHAAPVDPDGEHVLRGLRRVTSG